MPETDKTVDINREFTFSTEEQALIKRKLAQSNFLHSEWSGEDLLALRVSIRNFYRLEQNGNCAFCRNPISLQSAQNSNIEHIVPKSLHLEFIFEPKNLCVLCADCNEIKRNQETLNNIPDTLELINGKPRKRYPTISDGFKIFHPHFDIYDEHILRVGELYLDLSTKGNFTIGACKLNRKLHVFGWPEELLSDEQIIELFDSFKKATSSVVRTRILQRIKTISMLNS